MDYGGPVGLALISRAAFISRYWNHRAQWTNVLSSPCTSAPRFPCLFSCCLLAGATELDLYQGCSCCVCLVCPRDWVTVAGDGDF
jgi:hypothetical protein